MLCTFTVCSDGRCPCVVDCEHVFHRYLCGLLLGQLAAPCHAFVGLGPFAAVVVLKVAGGLLAVLLPVVPSFGAYVRAKFAVHEQRVAIVAPWAAQVNLSGFWFCREAAVVEHVAVFYILRR